MFLINIFFIFRSQLQDKDPFILLKIIFVDGGYHQIGKLLINIMHAFYMSSILLEFNYLIENFSINLLLIEHKAPRTISVELYVSNFLFQQIKLKNFRVF